MCQWCGRSGYDHVTEQINGDHVTDHYKWRVNLSIIGQEIDRVTIGHYVFSLFR